MSIRGCLSPFVGVCLFIVAVCCDGRAADERIRAAQERVHRNRQISALVRITNSSAEKPRLAADMEIVRVSQTVLDQPADSFFDDLHSARLTIESRLSGATEEMRRKYETLVSADANAALDEALVDPTIASLRSVCRRYFLTAAGYGAAERLIVLWLDSGEYDLAARLGAAVLSEPAHRGRITANFRKLAGSLSAISRTESSNTTDDGPEPRDVAQFQSRFRRHQKELAPLDAGWMSLGGNGAGGKTIAGSAPVPVVAWKADLFRNPPSSAMHDFLEDWEGTRREIDEPCSPASYPIVVDGEVVFRDSVGVRAVDAALGKTIWSYPCNYSPIRSDARRQDVGIRGRASFGMSIPGVGGGTNPFGENSLMGAISSDGQLVFAIDSADVGDADLEVQEIGAPLRPFRNRVVALHARKGSVAGRVAWVNEGHIPDRMKRPGGPKRFTFLGPPLPGAAELLCVTEHDIEVHLTSLDPRSGAVIWSQPLCTVDRTEQFDLERHETACLPVRAEGIVVCPTNSGLIVAVDQARMNLLWAAFVDDLPDPKRPQTRGTFRSPAAGYAGYASHVMIANGFVVYVPPHSSQVHCLELATGKFRWSVPRSGAEFVGAVSGGRVLVVGRQGCRSLALDDGREVWSVTTGTPAGRGITIGDHYIVPLEGGRFASLEMNSGRDVGTKALRSDVPLGHLVGDLDRVYSLSSRGLAAFPQVDYVLANAGAANLDDSSRRRRAIELAEVAMVQGNLADAQRQFRAIPSEQLTAADRDRSRRDLKELLFQRIEQSQDAAAADLEQLDRLAETPEDQFRFLLAVSSDQSPLTDKLRAQQIANRVYGLPPRVTGAMRGEEDWLISPSVWFRLQLKHSRNERFGREVQQLYNGQNAALLGNESTAELQCYIRAFRGESNVAMVQLELASRFAAAGDVQLAETLWSAARADGEPRVAASATWRLMELCQQAGFVSDAAQQLELLATRFRDTTLPDGLTGAAFVRQMSRKHPAKQAWRQSREPAWGVSHVEIRQTSVRPDFTQVVIPARTTEGSSPALFQSDRISVAPVRSLRYQWQPVELVVSPSEFDDRQLLSLFDHRTKSRLGSLMVPLLHRFPGVDKVVTSGHLIPVGIPGGMIGVSTLQLSEGEPVWRQLPADLAGRRSPAIPGPAGTDFASFSWRNWVYVVDSLDGTLLWQRKIPIPSQELNPNFRLDLIGDRQALAVHRITDAGDGTTTFSYEVFETATGRKLSTVRPGFVSGQWRGSYGRHIVGFADREGGRRLEIRDLLKEVPDVSVAVSDARQPMILPGGELIYIGSAGEVRIFDIARCQEKFKYQLEPSEVLQIRQVQVLSDRSRYFINLRRHAPTATTVHSNQPINGSQVSGLPVGDDLYAFDRASGELLWKRAIPYRTVLQFPECQLPFLVMISQVNDRVNSSLQSLTIEVIDSSSGVTIGYRDHLKFDQLLSAHYDGEAGRIHLRGQSSDIELRFGPQEGESQAVR